MEAVMIHHSSQNQNMSPYKSHIRNPKTTMMNNENIFPSNIIHTGLLQTPNLFLSHSFPPYSSFPQQPPFLPRQPPPQLISRVLSCPPINRKPNNYRTPKKTKPSANISPKKEEIKSKKTTRVAKPSLTTTKDVSKVLSLSSAVSSSNSDSVGKISVSSVKAIEEGDTDQMDMFSGSVVYTISPPPSSLPLPTFSLRPKLSCNAQAAAGIDTGATDNLRRLLRLV